MNREQAVADLTNVMSKFTAYIGKRLPTDVTQKLGDLREKEVNFLAKEVYESMRQNQEAADKLDRPSCQDTGVMVSKDIRIWPPSRSVASGPLPL